MPKRTEQIGNGALIGAGDNFVYIQNHEYDKTPTILGDPQESSSTNFRLHSQKLKVKCGLSMVVGLAFVLN
jgi:hypothetical protein